MESREIGLKTFEETGNGFPFKGPLNDFSMHRNLKGVEWVELNLCNKRH